MRKSWIMAAGLVMSGCVGPTTMPRAGMSARSPETHASAQGTANAPLSRVARNAQAALVAVGVWIERREQETGRFVYRGFRNGLEVRVELDSQTANLTRVQVSARKNGVTWNQRFAESLVGRILSWR